MLEMKRISFSRFIKMSLVSVFLMASAGQALAAKGAGGGRTFDVAINPGTCVLNNAADPSTTPSLLIRSSQGINYFMLQVVGPNSVGTWDITYTKDGAPVNTYNNFVVPPPGGWAVTGGSADKGAKTLKATGVATNRDNGMVCSATISHIF